MATDDYLSARRLHEGHAGGSTGRDECVWCDAQGRVKAALSLPARGHSFAIDAARQRAVVFGRQPGFFAYAFSWGAHRALPPEPLPLPAERHFYGHGVYAPDGRILYATENDYVNARGVIGVYDARPGRGHARVGEFDSGGLGPHDIVLMPDGQTLCVANGGLQTHPEFGKSILNMASMASSLTYLNRHTGQVLQTHTLEHALPAAWRHLSLRHLAVDDTGAVWIGGQYLNPDGQRPALVWRHTRGQDVRPVACPPAQQRAMRNYVGSVATNRRGTVVAATSPVGGRALFWKVVQATDAITLLDVVILPDVCGIAPCGAEGFLFSSGYGALVRHDPVHATSVRADGSPLSMATSAVAPLAWDNHLCLLEEYPRTMD